MPQSQGHYAKDPHFQTVTHRVVLDGSRYATALTVTQDGMVAPIADGADAIIGRQSADDVINRGRIAGAGGHLGERGGTGVDLAAGGTIVNRGSIVGGVADVAMSPIMGGNGVDLRGGTLTNSGTITGGALTGNFFEDYSRGGTGVRGFGGKVTIDNTGSIIGGGGWSGQGGFNAASGGVGIDLSAGGTIATTGTIEGGSTGSGRGVAVQLAPAAELINHGTIQGGNETAGAIVGVNGLVSNDGTIQGYDGVTGFGSGASGVQITGGSLSNSGIIEGGTGALSRFFRVQYGPGAGIDASATAIVNRGEVEGGNAIGSAEGGTGINLDAAGTLHNFDTILGGMGGAASYDGAGDGGTGVVLSTGASAVNSGLIVAGGRRGLFRGPAFRR